MIDIISFIKLSNKDKGHDNNNTGYNNSNIEDSNTRYTKGEYIILLKYILILKSYLKDKVIGVKVNYLRGYTYTINSN